MNKLIAALLLAFSASASATTEIIVPFPPGGVVDSIAREISQATTSATVVINKPGADGIIAGEYFLSNQSNKIFMYTTGSGLFAKLNNPAMPYDPLVDFDPIGPIVTASTVLVVSDKSKIESFDELVQASKKKPVSCGTSNAMATFYANYLVKTQGINMTIVPYKGTAPALTDLLGGHIDCTIDAVPAFVSRPVRPLLLSAQDQTKNFSAPIVSDSGYKFENFFAIAPGRNMDPTVKRKIIDDTVALTKNPEFVKSMASKGFHVNKSIDYNYSLKMKSDYRFLFDLQQTFK